MNTNSFAIVLTILLAVLVVLLVCDIFLGVFFICRHRAHLNPCRKHKSSRRRRWRLSYDEERIQDGLFCGILTDGTNYLFTRCADEGGVVRFSVFNSIYCSLMSLVVEFDYTPKNLKTLLDALDSAGPLYGTDSYFFALPFEKVEPVTPDSGEYCYQPWLVPEDEANAVLPNCLEPNEVFKTEADAKAWLARMEYDEPSVVKRIKLSDVEDPHFLNFNGRPLM